MKHLSTIILAVLLLLLPGKTSAQCSYQNTAFNAGEQLSYNLYFKWGAMVKAGTASMTVGASTYNGQKTYKASLLTAGNSKADKMFVLRDTLLAQVTHELVPLYYRKGAKEGKRYTVDEIFYTYPSGKCHVKQHRLHGNGSNSWEQHTYGDCVYDMLSIILRARSYPLGTWKKGHVESFPIADGNGRTPAKVQCNGTIDIKADNGKTYHCIELVYMESKKGKYKELVKFYVTNDQNHIPVRLDMMLNIGTARAVLTTMKGNRHPVTSVAQ